MRAPPSHDPNPTPVVALRVPPPRQRRAAAGPRAPRARRYLFARLSPLLGAAVALEGGAAGGAGRIEVTLTPAGLALPAEVTAVRLAPMQLALASRGPVHNLIRLLKLGDKGVAEAPRLEAWTSAIRADAHRSGALVTHRWDLLLGPSARAGHGAPPPAPAPLSAMRRAQCASGARPARRRSLLLGLPARPGHSCPWLP